MKPRWNHDESQGLMSENQAHQHSSVRCIYIYNHIPSFFVKSHSLFFRAVLPTCWTSQKYVSDFWRDACSTSWFLDIEIVQIDSPERWSSHEKSFFPRIDMGRIMWMWLMNIDFHDWYHLQNGHDFYHWWIRPPFYFMPYYLHFPLLWKLWKIIWITTTWISWR